MRQRRTLLTVLLMGVALVLSCIVWAIVVQTVVPNVCQLPHVPARAGYVSCPAHAPEHHPTSSAHPSG